MKFNYNSYMKFDNILGPFGPLFFSIVGLDNSALIKKFTILEFYYKSWLPNPISNGWWSKKLASNLFIFWGAAAQGLHWWCRPNVQWIERLNTSLASPLRSRSIQHIHRKRSVERLLHFFHRLFLSKCKNIFGWNIKI